ncbi:MAG: 3-methyl-2-oxobutanoate hydroxymethyltransferase [Chitinophagales bacterium]
MARVTTATLKDKKLKNEKITVLTAYDYSTAMMEDEAGIDVLLVGDSLGMVILGYENTLAVTMEDMIHHTKAVTRGCKNAMVVGDMPFLSYHVSIPESVKNAGRFLQEAGAHAVKLEGGRERVETIKAILDAEIPVMGHIGLTPQSVQKMGGFKVQGRDVETAKRLIEDAIALDKAGVFSMVLEGVPAALAEKITQEVSVPTIGIGAGAGCDGQVLVVNDMLGMYGGHIPKFVKKFGDLHPIILESFKAYRDEVMKGTFPAEEHTYCMKEEVLDKLYGNR